eukprot:4321238-Pyramimonas_sp.AAC.1
MEAYGRGPHLAIFIHHGKRGGDPGGGGLQGARPRVEAAGRTGLPRPSMGKESLGAAASTNRMHYSRRHSNHRHGRKRS